MDDFKRLAKIFKENFPEYLIRVRRVKMASGDAGDCECISKSKNEFLIRINKDIEKDEQLLWLIHECAHVISWKYKGDDHSLHWGKAYSKVYNIYLEKFIGDEK